MKAERSIIWMNGEGWITHLARNSLSSCENCRTVLSGI